MIFFKLCFYVSKIVFKDRSMTFNLKSYVSGIYNVFFCMFIVLSLCHLNSLLNRGAKKIYVVRFNKIFYFDYRFLAMTTDHIVILILLLALTLKYYFFDDVDDLVNSAIQNRSK